MDNRVFQFNGAKGLMCFLVKMMKEDLEGETVKPLEGRCFIGRSIGRSF